MDNKLIVRRVYEEMFNRKDPSLADELYDAGHSYNDPSAPALPDGPAGIKALVSAYALGFPDLHMTVDDVVAENDRAVVRWKSRATHTGSLMGIPPTGRQIEVGGTTVFRLRNGKIVESWAIWDNMGMMQQLGLVPTATA